MLPEIITYNPAYRQNFIDLNIEWLCKYFIVEPHDQNVFDKLEDIILAPGGEIFFCIHNNEVVGTVAMQKIDDQTFELAKMAVTEKYKGLGFSKLLMKACLDFARQKNASHIMLVSNRSLAPALSLYKRYGFVEVPMDPTDYSRADIQMELSL